MSTQDQRIITIDGPAGSGKSTVARAISEKTGIPYLSTGSLYRAIAAAALDQDLSPTEGAPLQQFLDAVEVALQPKSSGQGFDIVLNGQALNEATLRSEPVSQAASQFAALPAVRAKLLDIQRQAGRDGVIVEGRDTGSVIFPDADLKIYLEADANERARRRATELGLDPDDPEILSELKQRDARDSGRDTAPLVVPEGAIKIDCSELSVEQVVGKVLNLLG